MKIQALVLLIFALAVVVMMPTLLGRVLRVRHWRPRFNQRLAWLDQRPENIKWAGNQEAVTVLGYRPIRS
jgi:hypothetical protein